MPLVTGPAAYTLVKTRKSAGSKAEATALTTSLVLLAGVKSRPSFRPNSFLPLLSTTSTPQRVRSSGGASSRRFSRFSRL